MKRKAFLLIAMAMLVACMLAFGISAKEYNPTTGAELNSAISEAVTLNEDSIINLSGSYTDYNTNIGYTINSASKITFELKGDAELACRFFVTGEGTAIFNLNGYTITNKKSKGGVEGSFACIDEDGTLEMYNGSVVINDVAFAFEDGALKLNGVNVTANEETIWCHQNGCDGSGRLYQIENCVFTDKIGVHFYCMLDDSYIKNVTIISGSITFDSWHNHGAKECSAVIENIKASNCDVRLWTSANTYTLRNCEFKKATVGGDRGGAGAYYFYDVKYTERAYTDKSATLYDYKAPTCTDSGSLIVYSTKNQAGEEDISYKDNNPKLGHSFDKDNIIGVSYKSYLENGIYTSNCLRCTDGIASEEIGTAMPLFAFKGYSTPEDGSYGIVASFVVNYDALAKYEGLTGKTINYGIVAGAKQNLGDKNPLDENGNEAVLENGKVIKAGIDKKFTGYDFKLTGLNEAQLDTELVIATYVIVTEGEGESISTSVIYLQGKQATKNLSVITYNMVPKK